MVHEPHGHCPTGLRQHRLDALSRAAQLQPTQIGGKEYEAEIMDSAIVLTIFERRCMGYCLLKPLVVTGRSRKDEHHPPKKAVAPMCPSFAIPAKLTIDRVHRIVIGRIFLQE